MFGRERVSRHAGQQVHYFRRNVGRNRNGRRTYVRAAAEKISGLFLRCCACLPACCYSWPTSLPALANVLTGEFCLRAR